MPTIATIQRRRGALVIELEGTSGEHVLAREPVEALALAEGAALDDATWEELRATGRRRLVFERALTALSRRSHTEYDLRQRLGRQQFSSEEIDTAVVRLRELGYLDDARWAADFVDARRGRLGGRRLRQDLARRGVPREHVEAATSDLDETPAAIATARRRLPSLRRYEPMQQQRRLYGYLQRRGFSHDATKRAVSEVLGAETHVD
jgi:regulatory protein